MHHLFNDPTEIDSSYDTFENMTTEDLTTAAEMFIFLNTCPPSDEANMQQWFTSWSKFFKDMFETQSPEIILLTLNRLTKIKDDGFIRVSENLFKRLASSLKLKYKDIQNLLPDSGRNFSLMEDTQVKESLNLKGKH